jgi:hypothetical protein
VKRVGALFVGAGSLVALLLAAFPLPAGAIVPRGFTIASVCAEDVPSAAALAPLIGTAAPDCGGGGADHAVEVYLSGSTGNVGFYAYPASKAHIVRPEIVAEFNGRGHKEHVAALGKNGVVWLFRGVPGAALFTRGGQFIWVDGSLTPSADIVPLAKAIYAQIG